MIPRAYIFALVGGFASALCYVALTTGSPVSFVLVNFSQAPLLMVGLAFGFVPAAIACGVVVVGLAAAAQLLTAFLFMIVLAVPVLYVVRQASLSRPRPGGGIEWYPAGPMLGGLAAYMLALLVVVVALFGGEIEAVARQSLMLLAQLSGGALGPRAETLAPYMPGVMLASVLLMTVVNVGLAQGALVRMQKAARPSPEWHTVAVPLWLVFALGIAALVAFLPDKLGMIGANAAIVAAIPFMLSGLAVLHAVSKRWPARALALGLIYTTTFILGWPTILVAGLGVVDQWLPLRRGRTA